jgi:CHAD domain-containing protein
MKRGREHPGRNGRKHSAHPALVCSPAVGAHLALGLDKHWRACEKELKKCRRDLSDERVHRLRVRTRRLMAQLSLLESLLSSPLLKTLQRRLKKALKALGPLRDAQVQLRFVESSRERYPCVGRFRKHLVQRERRFRKTARRKLKRFGTAKLRRRIATLQHNLAACSNRPGRQAIWARAIPRAAARAYGEVLRRRRAIDPTDLETIHQTRIAFKRFRYMAGAAWPLLPEVRWSAKQMAAYQRKMGAIQDIRVMMELTEKFGRRHKRQKQRLDTFRKHLSRRRELLVRAYLKEADLFRQAWTPGARANLVHGQPTARPM